MAKKASSPIRWVPVSGQWAFERDRVEYVQPEKDRSPVGVCLYPGAFRNGTASVKACIADQKAAARIIVGYSPATNSYYSVGVGGHGFAYVFSAYTQTEGWRAMQGVGSSSNLATDREYEIAVELSGQRLSLSVDSVRVLETVLPTPLDGDQTGLFAWGSQKVQFEGFSSSASDPRVFVVMQFGKPFDALYREVIAQVCKKLGFVAMRADDVFRPGVILEDIRQGILESDVIIAEITPVNANVYYELGYAHALEKPTILLANRTVEKLPFDISGYRVIFYDDTIGGKRDIEESLEKHLVGIRRGR